MEKYPISNEKIIIIGDVSKLYNVSKRTLRLYHDMGLLVPSYVDDKTGYRYYSSAQFPRLDMILQMKSAGLSLNQIKQMLNTQNLSLFEAVLGVQIDKLNGKIAEYKITRNSLIRQLDSCKHIRNPPVLDSVFIEYIPRRTAYIYNIENYDLQKEYPGGSPWAVALSQLKAIFVEKELPLALFHQVGCIVSQESLLQNQFICSGAFIQFNEDQQFGLPQSSIDPSPYVCMYHKYTAMDNAEERRGIQLLLKYISENEYQISGPCITQVVAEASVFDYNDSNILVKQQIPIKINL